MSALARLTDPDTSFEASKGSKLTQIQETVFGYLEEAKEKGLTTNELSQLSSIPLVTVSPRMKPLADMGLIKDSGERRTGDSGRASIVWVLSVYAVDDKADVVDNVKYEINFEGKNRTANRREKISVNGEKFSAESLHVIAGLIASGSLVVQMAM